MGPRYGAIGVVFLEVDDSSRHRVTSPMRRNDRFLIRVCCFAALTLAPLVLATARAQNDAEAAFPASQLQFKSVFASRAATRAVYCLLGNGFFRAPSSGDIDALIAAFLAAHPAAQAVPVTVTAQNIGNAKSGVPMIYIWVEDGDVNLNVNLVREGAYPGNVMLDVVQAFGGRIASMKDEEKPRRLIANDKYQAFIARVAGAQDAAKAEKKGVWSDEFQERINGPERP